MSENAEILILIDEWSAALQSGEAANVVELYADDAILVPTLASALCHGQEEIFAYFEGVVASRPRVVIDEANIRVVGEVAVNSGLYTLTMADASVVPARFTFVYQRLAGGWRIVAHHSSQYR